MSFYKPNPFKKLLHATPLFFAIFLDMCGHTDTKILDMCGHTDMKFLDMCGHTDI